MALLDFNMEVMDKSGFPDPTNAERSTRNVLVKAGNSMRSEIEEKYPDSN